METVSNFTAYVWAAVIMIVFLLAAIIISSMISYKPNNPGTTTKRIIFWVCAVLTFAAAFLVNIGIAHSIELPSEKSSYETAGLIGAGVAFVLFIVFGFVISKIFRQSKIGTWF